MKLKINTPIKNIIKPGILFLIGISFASVIEAQTLSSGLVSYWKLDESSGTTTYDAHGSNNGTVMGPAIGQNVKELGSSYYFDGSNDYVSIPNSSSLDITGTAISLSVWIYTTSSNGTQVIFSKIVQQDAHPYPYFQYNLQLYYSSSKLYPRFLLSIGGNYYYASDVNYNITSNTWHHIVGTYDGSTMRLYVDGAINATKSVTGSIDHYSAPVYIGVNGALNEAFKGYIDETGVWNRTLSASEVSTLYNMGTGMSYENITGSDNVPVTGVSVLPTIDNVNVGTTTTLTATVSPGNASNQSITWSSNNTAVATVSSTGMVLGVSEGNATITATTADGGFTATSSINVNAGSSSSTSIWENNAGNIFYNTGNVGIGTTTDLSAKLTVNGDIKATRINVVSSITSDFVFDKNYNLLNLEELEKYVSTNKHLPEIPSAGELKKTGYNMGEMDDLLLRKIEELTLYIIEQNKIIENQNKRIEKLEKKNP